MSQKLYQPKLKQGSKNSINYLTRKKNLLVDSSYQYQNNPTKLLKFPEEIYKNANKMKELNLLFTWYKAKSLSVSGRFKTQNELAYKIHAINNSLIKKQSLSTIKKHLASLEQKGLIIRTKDSLLICKYDVLFEHFKINLETPRLFKINLEDLYNGKYFQTLIKKNLQKQEQKIKDQYFKKYCSSMKIDFDNKGRLKRNTNRFLNQNLHRLIKFQIKNQNAKKFGYDYNQDFDNKTKNLNFDITISQKKISELFGFKSIANGNKIIKFLEKEKLIHLQKRFLCLKNIDHKVYAQLLRSQLLPNHSFYKNGSIFIRLSNLISMDSSILNEKDNVIFLYHNNIMNFNLNMMMK